VTKTELTMRINHTTFNTGNAIVLAEGSDKYVREVFLRLKHVEWASVKDPHADQQPPREVDA
jgi:hypothetical protein